MTERQRLEAELEVVNLIIDMLQQKLAEYQRNALILTGQLNRARRLEREELQNAERKSYEGY